MQARSILPLLLLLIPAAASAVDRAERCQELASQIAQAPEIIGNNRTARAYGMNLSQQNSEIRKIRTEMRRMGCGAGSIVALGDHEPGSCAEMSNMLADMEANRQAIQTQRQIKGQDTLVRRVLPEEPQIRAEMARLKCDQLDMETVTTSLDAQPLREAARPELQTPSITKIGPKPLPKQVVTRDYGPPPPDRPWDPSRPIRNVGPQFFPDDRAFDLTNPDQQPQQ